jgi:hypothetical protein
LAGAETEGAQEAGASDASDASGDPDAASDDAGSAASSLSLTLNASGRVALSGGAVDLRTRAFQCLLGRELSGAPALHAALLRDCASVFCETSFWLGAGARPRCALESLARDVFEFHARSAQFDAACSGAEWWVQLRRVGDESAGPEDIGFHWDKDEDLVDSHGLNVHPQVSTVTYLAARGAPTLVLDGTEPGLEYGDLNAVRRPVLGAHLSRPVLGKHLAFDGHLLHGAPKALSPPEDRGTLRCTLLVNVWLNHRPTGVEVFPDDALPQLALAAGALSLGLRHEGLVLPAKVLAGRGRGASQQLAFPFGPSGWEHVLRLALPPLADLSADHGAFDLVLARGTARVEPGAPPEPRRSKRLRA